jgi:putative DNA primase/helicase
MAKEKGWHRDVQTTPTPAPRRAPKPQQSNTARYAAELWLRANKWMQADNWLSQPSPDESIATHPYAVAKGITHAGGAGRVIATGSKIGKNADCIIVPVRERGIGKVQAVECINPEGRKQTFGPKSGGYLLLGNTLDKSIPWFVVEGWADAYSVIWHLNNPDGSKRDNCVCAVAFGKGNLENCAKQILQHHDPDNDVLVIHDAERSR